MATGTTEVDFGTGPGSPNATGVTWLRPLFVEYNWTRTTTVASCVGAHGLATNDWIAIRASSDVAAVALGFVQVTVTTPLLFTFTCSNAGAAAGTFSWAYAPTWARATTTATVTDAAHGLTTGDWVNIADTDDPTAVPTGRVQVSVSSASVFTFTCLNAGAASGKLVWERTGEVQMHNTKVYVESTAHGMVTGDAINITVSSDTSAVALGNTFVSVIDANHFSIKVVQHSTGAGVGTLTFTNVSGRGANQASITVTGQTSILATSDVEAWLMYEASTNHTANDQAYASALASLACSVPSAGVGFTIYMTSTEKLTGKFKVRWVWA